VLRIGNGDRCRPRGNHHRGEPLALSHTEAVHQRGLSGHGCPKPSNSRRLRPLPRNTLHNATKGLHAIRTRRMAMFARALSALGASLAAMSAAPERADHFLFPRDSKSTVTSDRTARPGRPAERAWCSRIRSTSITGSARSDWRREPLTGSQRGNTRDGLVVAWDDQPSLSPPALADWTARWCSSGPEKPLRCIGSDCVAGSKARQSMLAL
jgi:hypothetical protein